MCLVCVAYCSEHGKSEDGGNLLTYLKYQKEGFIYFLHQDRLDTGCKVQPGLVTNILDIVTIEAYFAPDDNTRLLFMGEIEN